MTPKRKPSEGRVLARKKCNPADNPEDTERTRVHGHTKPFDLCLPAGDGTMTREEYYRNRGDDDEG